MMENQNGKESGDQMETGVNGEIGHKRGINMHQP